ncbi:hypothetical protein [Pedobacter sp. SYSU D00535]|uniref:hypothetical protein n=1 Tax=Pedobacter sp. SYSU D00535 TaxID=2810308 RepID=UPI001A964705|nr:hypothetical protein [Pedobacter sp. SYSU D00535]
MRDDVKLLLLKLVKHNGNIQPIIKMGFEYSQIVGFINELLAEGALAKINNKYELTEAGEQEINTLNKELKRLNSAQWIEPATEFRITKIDKNDVFLPDQDELSF